jgi:hypothetical protein
MSIKLPKYVVPRKNKDGSKRFYFQVPKHMRPENWPPYISLSSDTLEMFKQAQDLLARMNAERGGTTVKPHAKGSFPWLLAEYHKSDRYRNLAPRTQDLYDYCAKFIIDFSATVNHPHVRYITRPIAFKFLEKFSDKPTKRKKIYVFLRVLMGYAFDIGEIENNPVLQMNMAEPEAKVHIWTDEEEAAIIAKADELGMPEIGTAVMIGFETGQRQGDVLSKKHGSDYSDGQFLFRQNKTKELVSFPATERLQARLEKRNTGYLVLDPKGRPYVRQDFAKHFSEVRKECGLTHCIYGQLRHTAVVRLARASCTAPEIASITGHTVSSVAAILKRYLPRDTKVAKNAIDKVETSRKTPP